MLLLKLFYLCKSVIQNFSNVAKEAMGVFPQLTKIQCKTLECKDVKFEAPNPKKHLLSTCIKEYRCKIEVTESAASMKGGKMDSILALPTAIATIPTSSVALALATKSASLVNTIKHFINSRTFSAYGMKAPSAAEAKDPIADCIGTEKTT
jgi:hypothetical protein